jgi:hypothetical protein
MSNPNQRNTTNSANNNGISSEDASYEEGYARGQGLERLRQDESYIEREDNRGANSFLIGLALIALVGLVGGALFFMNQGQQSPTQVLPIPVPNNNQPQNSKPESSQKETTIIDRTIERTKEVVPVPQQQAPASQQQAPAAPDININVPSTENQAPETNASPEQSQNQDANQGNSNPN